MMIGEVDYGSIVVDAKAEINDESGAPLVHLPEFTAIIVCLFCMIVSVLVMNLLVSEDLMGGERRAISTSTLGYKMARHRS